MKTAAAVTVRREDLLRVLESVQPGLATKEGIEQGTCFCFTPGKLTTFNEDVSCEAPLTEKTGLADFPLRGAVRADRFLGFLRLLEREEVKVVQQEGSVLVRSGPEKSLFPCERQVLLPCDDVEKEGGRWQELPADFAEALERVGKCASTDEYHKKMGCVHLHPDYLEACSDDEACRWTLATGVTEEALAPWTSLKALPPLGIRQVAESPYWLHFRNVDGLVVRVKKYLDDYPNLDDTFAVKGRKLILPQSLVGCAKRAELFSKESADDNWLYVTLKAGRIELRARSSIHGEYAAASDKIAYDGPGLDFRMPPTILASCVQQYGDKLQVNEKKHRLIARGQSWVYLVCAGPTPVPRPQPQTSTNGKEAR